MQIVQIILPKHRSTPIPQIHLRLEPLGRVRRLRFIPSVLLTDNVTVNCIARSADRVDPCIRRTRIEGSGNVLRWVADLDFSLLGRTKGREGRLAVYEVFEAVIIVD